MVEAAPVVLICRDLMTGSQVAGGVRALGRVMKTVGTPAAAGQKIAELKPAMVVLDLKTPDLDPAVLVPQIREQAGPGVPIVAFGPHVQVDALEAAQQAGCDHVFTNGQFLTRLPQQLLACGLSTESSP